MPSLTHHFQDGICSLEPTHFSDGFSLRSVMMCLFFYISYDFIKFHFIVTLSIPMCTKRSFTGSLGGAHERRLLNDLMAQYQKLERPVMNESLAVTLKFGLTLQQIMDVVSQLRNTKHPK